MEKYLKPGELARLGEKIFPYFSTATIILVLTALYIGFFASPPDYQQGETVRIMYVHVPSAWMSLGIYTLMAVSSFIYLVWRAPVFDLISRCAAPIGAGFTLLCLISGALWGKPIWGTWWVWDARLTSVLILFFFYLGYIALVNSFDNREQGAKSAAILAIVGFINVPIIKFSVDWWNTLHQPASVLRFDGPAIHSSMLTPLLLMFAGFICFFIVVLVLRIKYDILARKIIRLQMHKIAR